MDARARDTGIALSIIPGFHVVKLSGRGAAELRLTESRLGNRVGRACMLLGAERRAGAGL